MLYEANYAEWIEKVATMLLSISYSKLSFTEDETQSGSVQEFQLLQRYVRPEILQRVPDDSKTDPDRLMAALKKVANPFRLMDLPSEVRVLIFSKVLRQSSNVFLLSTPKTYPNYGKVRTQKPPPLTTLSRMVREETMPLYYQLNTFQFALNHLSITITYDSDDTDTDDSDTEETDTIDDNDSLRHLRWVPKDDFNFPFDSADSDFGGNLPFSKFGTRTVLLWAEAHKHWLKHLRKMLVSYAIIEGETGKPGEGFLMVESALDPKLGLSTSSSRTRGANKKVEVAGLHEHTEQLETYRRFLGLEGEVLTMLWSSDLRTWATVKNIAEGKA